MRAVERWELGWGLGRGGEGGEGGGNVQSSSSRRTVIGGVFVIEAGGGLGIRSSDVDVENWGASGVTVETGREYE